ncbi:family transcriptional regulator [Diplodia corticola]|uniref:Family transcriptional regulator n=1 Tax=Diplodia corticola TaxID=236234 RepID=A0A1J9QLV4_9PEZI|nr:family transcriptional regulator [Diplodia corticola]OJD29441.1 family transcriptional regulator [Diplodia corticola]
MPTLAITGASGKLGGAVLRNLLSHDLSPPASIVATTSGSPDDSPRWQALKDRGVAVRHASYDDPASMEAAFRGCTRLLLVSTPRIGMDFDDAAPGRGREAHHVAAIDAARAAGVRHVYYTSLGFGSGAAAGAAAAGSGMSGRSKAGVMRAHDRTEAYLRSLPPASDSSGGIDHTILREGLYNESWPLYLGHGELLTGGDEREEVVVAGDGRISWAAIDDLGLATAAILAAGDEERARRWAGATATLATTAPVTLREVAAMVSKARGRKVELKVVGRDEHERYYVERRGVEEAYVKWWSTTYDAVRDGECDHQDPLLERILARFGGRKPKPIRETIEEMFA